MFNFKRKNNALNNAASGLERGLQAGLGIGMQAHRQQQDEEQAQFQREQALKAGQRADAELQREQGQRQAEGAAVSELSAPEPKVNFSDSPMFGPAISAAGATVQHDEVTSRVQSIAKKMSEMGTPLGQVKAFLDAARETHTKNVDDGERKFLVDAIHRDVQSDTLFATKPDHTRESNPETEKAAQALVDLSGNPNVPISELRAQRVKLKQAISADRSRLAHRKSMVMALDTDLANLASQFRTQPGPITAAQSEAQSRQIHRLQTLRDQFDVFYDEIHEAKGGALSFSNQWNDAKNGIEYYRKRADGSSEPVSFAAADQVRSVEQERDQYKTELDQYKAEREAKNIENDATRAQAAKTSAEAAMLRANQRPPARPIPDTSVADYSKIAEIVDSRLLSDETYKGLESDTEKAAYRTNKMAEERNAARTLSDQNNQDRAALGNRKGKGDDARKREEDAIANPQNYPDMTAEEFDHFVETGELPKKK